jgi:DnaK suppressor protein
MTDDKLEYFKKIFQDKLIECSRQKQIEIDEAGDEYDKASALVLESVEKTISGRNFLKEASIKRALKRIESGTFGVCEECGEDIADMRLLIVPEASTCIVCADKLERLSKQFTR